MCSIFIPLSIIAIYVTALPAEGAVTVTIGTAYTAGLEREIDTIFGFLSNSDTLVLLDSSSIDRETIDEIEFSVVATDTIFQTATADVTVVINDANDESPNITNAG